jgi:allantoin racemase
LKRICLINPNTTRSMTEACADAAKLVLGDRMQIDALTVSSGPESIEGHYDGAVATVGLMETLRANPDADGYIIGCFDDTGLDAARCLVDAPVVGMGEASFHIASLLANRFAVITTLGRSVPIIEDNLERYGLGRRCVAVLATDVPVLELESKDGAAEIKIEEQMRQARELGAEAVVLGCAGMVAMTRRLSEKFGMPVVDGITGAAGLVATLIDLELTTAKLGGYASPVSKAYHGNLASLGPARE